MKNMVALFFMSIYYLLLRLMQAIYAYINAVKRLTGIKMTVNLSDGFAISFNSSGSDSLGKTTKSGSEILEKKDCPVSIEEDPGTVAVSWNSRGGITTALSMSVQRI